MKSGEQVRVINGIGKAWKAQLKLVHEKECVAEIISEELVSQKASGLHIAIAPTKNMDRVEWFAEKATELGIRQISFLISKNSERKIIKTERIKKICESAVKQSMQSFLPIIHEAIEFRKFVELHAAFKGKKLIAHCEEEQKQDVKNEIQPETLILIGPEGDFTPEEIDLALKKGFIPVSLGESRLRTETAGVYIASICR